MASDSLPLGPDSSPADPLASCPASGPAFGLTAAEACLRQRAAQVERFLQASFTDPDIPPRLASAVRYSLLAGGKRLRPVLCLSAALACQNPEDDSFPQAVMPFAAALEMIHSYSLIHDDLPAMDDDDLRRGKPSNHKAFDEATAILAGDALLTNAFAYAASCPLPPERLVPALGLLAEAAGAGGMVGGQMLDIGGEGRRLSRDELADLNARKTGALLRAACACGAMLAGADAIRRDALQDYGRELGMAFQINDDILDVIGEEQSLGKTPGKDARQGKATWPGLLGLEASRRLAAEHSAQAEAALPRALFPGRSAEFLRGLPAFLLQRDH